MKLSDKVNFFIFLLIFLAPVGVLHSFSFFEEGERLFMENRLEEAADMLEAAVGEDPENERSYLYLSIIYEKFGEYERAIAILEEGLKHAESHSARMHLNRGNNLFALEEYPKAVESYTEAIQSRSGYAEAYLNRANARVESNAIAEAINDYTLYLKLKPDTGQKENIEKVIDILKRRLAEEERKKRDEEKRRLEEERRRREEEQRTQEEARKKAEEERKRQEEERRRQEEERQRQEQLLKDILDSLKKAEENTNDLSADSEDIEEFDLELDLENQR